MRTYELVAMSIAAGAVVVPLVTWAVLWLFRRDRVYTSVTPGEVPADAEDAPTKLVGPGSVFSGEVPVRTTPPQGVSPGLAGVVLDGYADGRDIAAMVLDLARRGWLELAADTEGSEVRDWRITRVDQPLDAALDLNEVYLITNIAQPGGTTRMSELRAKGDNRLGLVQLDLAREVVARGWYPAPPSQPSDVPMAVLGVGGLLGIVVALVSVTPVTVCAGAVIVACAYLTSLIVRGNTSRTALGTAVRIQVLGFRDHLKGAHSHQFSFIDAADTFAEYLPWAVVFGLEQQWAETFADLGVVADTAHLHLAQDLRWFAGIQGPEDTLRPTPARPPEVAAARRRAVDDVPTEPAVEPVPVRATEPVPVVATAMEPAIIEAAPVATSLTDGEEQPVERFAPPAERRGVVAATTTLASKALAATTRAAAALAARVKPLLPVREKPDTTVRMPAASPATPVRIAAAPREPVAVVPTSPATSPQQPTAQEPAVAEVIAEIPAAVRQWVPRPSSRPVPLTARAKPAMPAAGVGAGPAAPVTPVRAPRGSDDAVSPATPAAATPVHVPTPVRVATPPRPAARRKTPVPRKAPPQVARPGGQTDSDHNPWSDWLDEFDLAMSGEFDAEGPDATEGGTVISGPARFDVLLAMPLWPDLPGDRSRPDRQAG